MEGFPLVLEAVTRAELSLWPVVDAVVAEIEATEAGSARNGEYDRCAAFLADNGFITWSSARLRMFRSVGVWVDEFAGRPSEFKDYPFEWVYEAKRAAKSGYDEALEILSKATSSRDIRPHASHNPRPMSTEQATETVQRIAREHPEAVARTVAEQPAVARAVASHPVARTRVDVAHTERKEEAGRQTRARNYREEIDNAGLGAMRFSARLGEVRTQMRLLVMDYREILTTNPELRDLLDERTITLKGDVILALDTLVGAGVDAALAEILRTEEVEG
jgi:hypothetical protein